MAKEYALYKGEDILAIGTLAEIAKKENVKKSTLYFYKTKSYKDRLSKRKTRNPRILIELEDYDD